MSPGGTVQQFLNRPRQSGGIGQGQARQGDQAGIQSQDVAGIGIKE
jgi:hypothetical protein